MTAKAKREFSLANLDDVISLTALLMASGSACLQWLGNGTRKTSKRWARCKREGCGHRVRVLSMDEAAAHLRAKGLVEPT